MLGRLRTFVPVLVIAIIAAAFLAGCEAADNAKVVKSGVDTTNYLASVQPQLEAYGATLSNLQVAGPVSAAKGARLQDAQVKLEKMQGDLEDVSASDDYKAAHAKLTAAVGSTAAILGDLAAACADGNQKAYDAALVRYTEGQAVFAKAMQAVTKPLVDAAQPAG